MIQGGAQRAEVGKDGDLLVVCHVFLSNRLCTFEVSGTILACRPLEFSKAGGIFYRLHYSLS